MIATIPKPSDVQAKYMQLLIEAARKKQQSEGLASMQGSVLVEVSLSKAQLKQAKRLGFKPTPTTLVRLEDGQHEKHYGSVIPLQEEFYFHLALASRVYEEVSKEVFRTRHHQILNEKNLARLIKTAHQEAMPEVNRHIQHAFENALEIATKPPPFNLAKFNKSLDKARKTITPIAHTILMEKIIEKTGIVFTPKDFKNAKHIAEHTPATTQDILYVNQTQNLVTLIKGSPHTAHHRVRGQDFAHRQLITHRIDNNGQVTAHPHPRIQIRTPSPVVKKGLKEAAIIQDVSDKLLHIKKSYRLGRSLRGKPRAFIYNRYTAINDVLGDLSGNLQTQSARHILQGTHKYNATQLDRGVFCFVQNISVNGFGDTLGYESADELVQESTLMAELALMHTLGKAKAPFAYYEQYLKASARAPYFSQTKEGKQAKVAIQAIKEKWKAAPATPDNNAIDNQVSIPTLVKHCLKKLIAEDAHCTHEHAKLIQVLSVYIEKASIGGCKSGNERAQAINGRVLMLDAIEESKYDAIKSQLHVLANAKREQVLFAATHLKEIIDKKYNEQGLYAAASMVSLADQGASAKVEAKPDGMYISRNYAEEHKSLMPNLQQSKAGAMQAHKGLTKYMRGAFVDYPEAYWSYMSSSFLGVFGAVLGIVTVLPAIVGALLHARDVALRTERRQCINERIQQFGQMLDKDVHVRAQQWLTQIGDYGFDKNNTVGKHLTLEGERALHRGTHKGIEPKTAREDFIRFLSIKFLKEVPFLRDESLQSQTIILEDLLGKEGIKLYQLAIEEESKSKSFRDAVFLKAIKHQPGPQWQKKLVLWVGGPSSSGKTFASEHILKTLTAHESRRLGVQEGDDSGNKVAFIDGTFERETSQMRQMVLQMALATGYKGIADLQKHSSALAVKHHIREAALQSKDISLVIPDTFVRDPLKVKGEMEHYKKLSKKGELVQVFSEVKPKITGDIASDNASAEHFKTAVKNMGDSRAWLDSSFEAKQIAMNNTAIGCESKAYQPQYFELGISCTNAARMCYEQMSEAPLILDAINDLMYLKKDAKGTWLPCEMEDDLSQSKEGKDFVRVTLRAYQAWSELKLKDEHLADLPQWYEQNKKNQAYTGPLISYREQQPVKPIQAPKISIFSDRGHTSKESSLPKPGASPNPQSQN